MANPFTILHNDTKVLILGKLPPPYYGTSVWAEQLNTSDDFEIFDTKIQKSLKSIGKFNISKVYIQINLYYKFYRYIKKLRPSIIIIPISQSLLGYIKDSLFIVISNMFCNKILLFLHGGNFHNWYKKQNALIKKYIKSTVKTAVGAVVLGENLRHIFYEFFPKEKVFVVPNGLDVKLPQNKYKKENIVNLLYLGNLQPSKGIKNVICAFSLINNCKNKYKLNIIGEWRDNDTKTWALDFVNNNKLPISFMGPRYNDDKFQELLKADIFIFTPLEEEGHPFVIIEAMAVGLPIITSNKGAISESIINYSNGIIVDPFNTHQMADAMKKLIEDPKLREQMGNNSRGRYELLYTKNKMIEKLKEVILQTDINF